MPVQWTDITSDDRWLGLEEEDKETIRQDYFDSVVAPSVPSFALDDMRQEFDERTSRTGKGLVNDLGERAYTGFLEMGLAGREIVGKISTKALDVLNKVDEWIYDVEEGGTEEFVNKHIEESYQDMSPRMRESMQKDWWDEEEEKLGLAAYDPYAYIGIIAQSTPETVATMLPAFKVGKMIYGMQRAKKVSEAVAAARAATGAQIAGSVLEGTMAGGHASLSVKDELSKLPDDVWEKSDVFQELIASGMTEDEAKTNIMESSSTQALLMATGVTMAFGGWGDRMLTQGILRGLKGGIAKRIGVGAVAESIEEGPQEGGAQIAENIAIQNVDPTRSTGEGVINATIGGVAGGAPMGAAFGAVTKQADLIDEIGKADNIDELVDSVADVANASDEMNEMFWAQEMERKEMERRNAPGEMRMLVDRLGIDQERIARMRGQVETGRQRTEEAQQRTEEAQQREADRKTREFLEQEYARQLETQPVYTEPATEPTAMQLALQRAGAVQSTAEAPSSKTIREDQTAAAQERPQLERREDLGQPDREFVAAEGRRPPDAAPQKTVGQAHRVAGTESVVADTQRVEGVDYELYRPAVEDGQWTTRIFDVDSGETVGITQHPTKEEAIAAHQANVGEKVELRPELTEPKPVKEAPPKLAGDLPKTQQALGRMVAAREAGDPRAEEAARRETLQFLEEEIVPQATSGAMPETADTATLTVKTKATTKEEHAPGLPQTTYTVDTSNAGNFLVRGDTTEIRGIARDSGLTGGVPLRKGGLRFKAEQAEAVAKAFPDTQPVEVKQTDEKQKDEAVRKPTQDADANQIDRADRDAQQPTQDADTDQDDRTEGIARGQAEDTSRQADDEADQDRVLTEKKSLLSYLGPKAATADLSALKRAAEMEQAGVPADQIREDTGWFLGMDDKWRFEVSDDVMTLRKNAKTQPGKPGHPPHWLLGDLVDHPQLFEAYPQLFEVKVETTPGLGVGNYNPDTNTIGVSQARRREVLAHEIQHIIQRIEEFARGGSIGAMARPEHEAEVSKEYQRGEAKRQSDLMNQAIMDGDADAAAEHRDLAAKHAPFQAYQRLAGEIEARDTQSRINMTAKDRSMLDPYTTEGIPKEEAILQYKDDGIEEAPQLLINVPKIIAELERDFGKANIKRMMAAEFLEIEETTPRYIPKGAGGTWDGHVLTLYADTLVSAGDGFASAVLTHEGEHAGMRLLLGNSYGTMQKRMDSLIKAGDPTAMAALERVPVETAEEFVQAERLAYFIEESYHRIQNKQAISGRARNFLRQLLNKIKAWFRQTDVGKALANAGIEWKLTEAYAVALAHRALQRATDAKIAGEPLPVPGETMFSLWHKKRTNPTSLENEKIRNGDKTLANKITNELHRQLSPGGLLPRTVFKLKITRDSEFEVVEMDIKNLVTHLEDAVKDVYGVSFHKLSDADVAVINESLGGTINPGLDKKIVHEIRKMRDYIDGISQQYGAILFDQAQQMKADGNIEGAAARAELLQTISDNMGEYVHRSYKVFDDPKWVEHVPDNVMDDARAYVTNAREQQALKLDKFASDARQRGEIEKAENHESNAANLRDPERINKTLRLILTEGTAFDSMEAFIKESKLGHKDLSILKHRKEIAPEIRALMGEHVDPRLNFAKSASKMSRLIYNQEFLDGVLKNGEGVFLWRDKEDAPIDATKVIATGDSYSPIEGMYTYPEVEQAFRDALNKEVMADWYRAVIQMNGMVKYGKTVLSPTTAFRNWMSAAFFSLANGHFDWSHGGTSVKAWKEYRHSKDQGVLFKYLRHLKQLGVVYDTPYAGEMMRLLAESKIEDMAASGAKLRVKSALDLATKFYQFGDDFWKIIGFENEKALLMKHKGLAEAEAEIQAAERIRNTYPTYSMTGRFVNTLRRFPLVGTFVSFPSEIIRTSYNMMRYAAQDMKDPDLRPLAMRRLTGLGIASGAAYAMQALFMTLIGVNDDEEEAFRIMAAPWQENSNLVPVGRDRKGNIRFLDFSFLDPYNYFKRPINAILRDQPWEDMAKDILRETLSPFFGEDIAFGAIWEGIKRLNPEDSVPQQTADLLKHISKNTQPGLTSWMGRMSKALDGEISPSGRQYDVKDEMMAFMGWRISTLDPKASLYYKVYGFQESKRNASRIISNIARDPNEVSDEDLKSSVDRANKARTKAYVELGKIVSAARKQGLSNAQIASILRANRISKKDVSALISGNVPDWSMTKRYMSGQIKKAGTLFDEERRKEFVRRRDLIIRYAGAL